MIDVPTQVPEINDDVDLYSLAKRATKVLNKRIKLIISFFLVGVIIGIAYNFLAPKTYQSRMVASSQFLRGSSFIIVLDNLQRHIKEKNYPEVAKALNIDMATASKIDKMQSFSIQNFAEKEYNEIVSIDEEDKEELAQFIVEAYVSDNSIWTELQEGIIYYLNNNEFSKVKGKQRKGGLKLVKNKIHSELTELDSLKYSINDIYTPANRNGNANIPSIYISDPSAIYNNILNLYKAEIETTDKLNTSDITVIQAFVPYKKPYSPRLSLSLIFCTLIALFLCAITIFVKEQKERASNR